MNEWGINEERARAGAPDSAAASRGLRSDTARKRQKAPPAVHISAAGTYIYILVGTEGQSGTLDEGYQSPC